MKEFLHLYFFHFALAYFYTYLFVYTCMHSTWMKTRRIKVGKFFFWFGNQKRNLTGWEKGKTWIGFFLSLWKLFWSGLLLHQWYSKITANMTHTQKPSLWGIYYPGTMKDKKITYVYNIVHVVHTLFACLQSMCPDVGAVVKV